MKTSDKLVKLMKEKGVKVYKNEKLLEKAGIDPAKVTAKVVEIAKGKLTTPAKEAPAKSKAEKPKGKDKANPDKKAPAEPKVKKSEKKAAKAEKAPDAPAKGKKAGKNGKEKKAKPANREHGQRHTIFGHSFCSFMRWMGLNGFSRDDARIVAKKHAPKASPTTLTLGFADGLRMAKGSKKIKPLHGSKLPEVSKKEKLEIKSLLASKTKP